MQAISAVDELAAFVTQPNRTQVSSFCFTDKWTGVLV